MLDKGACIFISLLCSLNAQEELPLTNITETSSAILTMCPEFGMETKCYGFKGFNYNFFSETVKNYLTKIQTDKSFLDENCWVNKNSQSTEIQNQENLSPYVLRKKINPDDTVFFIGDFHGSIHSLIRILFQLAAFNVIDNNLKIKDKKTHIVFLGDYVNRGSYGVEVVTYLCQLKINNWENVFLLRGNNEEWDLAHRLGFESELLQKFFRKQNNLLSDQKDLITKWFSSLPYALFLETGGKDEQLIQCCHGGIQENYSPLNMIKNQKLYEKINNYRSFNWGDFISEYSENINPVDTTTKRSLINQERTLSYFEKNNIKAVFRGHQDKFCGIKMFPQRPFSQKNLEQIDFGPYPQGPYPWRYIVSKEDQDNEAGFQFSKYFPVVTLTSAVEARALTHDCFCRLTFGENFDDWRLKTYEINLETTEERHRKYLSIDIDSKKNIIPKWTLSPFSQPIGKKLFDTLL